MAYTPNCPLGPQKINASQPIINANFQQLNTQFSVNHVALTAGSQNGKHTFVSMREQGADPATAANEGAIYTKLVGADDELFYRYQSNGAVVQLTSGGGVSPTNPGYCPLPGGLVFQWGNNFRNATGTFVITFPYTFTTSVFVCTGSWFTNGVINSNGAGGVSGPPGLASFTVDGPASNNLPGYFHWIAIGI